MSTLQEQIDTAQATADALKQKKVNEDGAPITKQHVDDVIAGVVPVVGGQEPVALTNIAARGITTEVDVIDGDWCVLVLPTDTATGDALVLLKAFAATLQAGGAQVVSIGDPVKIRGKHLFLETSLAQFETFFA